MMNCHRPQQHIQYLSSAAAWYVCSQRQASWLRCRTQLGTHQYMLLYPVSDAADVSLHAGTKGCLRTHQSYPILSQMHHMCPSTCRLPGTPAHSSFLLYPISDAIGSPLPAGGKGCLRTHQCYSILPLMQQTSLCLQAVRMPGRCFDRATSCAAPKESSSLLHAVSDAANSLSACRQPGMPGRCSVPGASYTRSTSWSTSGTSSLRASCARSSPTCSCSARAPRRSRTGPSLRRWARTHCLTHQSGKNGSL